MSELLRCHYCATLGTAEPATQVALFPYRTHQPICSAKRHRALLGGAPVRTITREDQATMPNPRLARVR